MPRCAICRKKFDYAFNKFEKVCSNLECKQAYLPTLLEEMEVIRQRAWKEKKAALRVEVPKKSNKVVLQAEINTLSREIDKRYGYLCIDCGKPFGKQTDASHFHNVGEVRLSNIRYNLHNVHSARSDCNQYHGGRKEGYYLGLVERYSQEYADWVKCDLRLLGGSKLSANDFVDKIALVRKIIRDMDDKLPFINGKVARDYYNGLIGIYEL
tara:strand:+ start:164 stop:796 length:633 start_codon:yes stop_codon:yes gene_type:complete